MSSNAALNSTFGRAFSKSRAAIPVWKTKLFSPLILMFCLAAVPTMSPSAQTTIPENAYPTGKAYGTGWKCIRGFSENYDKCKLIEVPQNAYLNSSGTGWSCHRGFKTSINRTCVPVVIPKNAFLTPHGDDWECEFPYRRSRNECVKPIAPANAHLTHASYGKGWECNRGYIESRDKCSAILLPKNAYLTGNSYDGGWKCDRGFESFEGQCVPISVPENAHLDHFGNNWECNRPFIKDGSICVHN